MYRNNEVISYLQTNKILALKLDHAVSGVGKVVSNQIEVTVLVRNERCITPPALRMNIRMSVRNKRWKIYDSRMASSILFSMVM